MADVLLARTTGLQGFERHVVIKRIRAAQSRDREFVKMFLDEARLAASLHHANVVQVHEVGVQDGEHYFAMEYIHGEDLRQLMTLAKRRDEQVPIEHAVTIVAAAAAGLHYAHEQQGPDGALLGIVHRDVSPSNILVGYDGSVKVTDFGIAKVAGAESSLSGTPLGKASYMSPEQCEGKPIDRRSDVFALGVVLYELIAGRRLFKGDSDFLTMSAVVSGIVPPPRRYRPELPAELERVLLTALATSPADRFQTAEEMRLALESCATDEGIRTSTYAVAEYLQLVAGKRELPWRSTAEREAVATDEVSGAAGEAATSGEAPEGPSAAPEGPSAATSSTEVEAAKRSRRTGIGIGALAAAVLALVAYFLVAAAGPRSNETTASPATVAPDKAPEPRAAPEAAPAAISPSEAPAVASPRAAPLATSSAATPEPASAGTGAVKEQRARPAKASARSAAPRAPTPKPADEDVDWDPKGLFPK